MALKTFVKVSGINNLSDARYCAGMGVNQLGFNIEPNHENYTDPKSFKELSDWVSGVEFVGEVECERNIEGLIADYAIDALQVSEISLIPSALASDKPVIYYSTDLQSAQKASNEYADQLSYILLEDESADANSVKELATKVDLVIGSGLEADSIDDLLNEVQLKGIALKGGNEIRPGYKDFDAMADILEALDADEYA